MVPQVRIVHLSSDALTALADGDLDAADAASPVGLDEWFIGPDWRSTWTLRRDQVRADPAAQSWVTGVIWDDVAQLAVGSAGFHGPPDEQGMVEVGYTVKEPLRRRGYGRAALAAMLDRARREQSVHVVRASISPGNTASRNLVAQFGFTLVGEQWDDEDGLELVYEVVVLG
jgi:RimJ/RimL family protein N-acetyltransferase